jgi:hypothetical protein
MRRLIGFALATCLTLCACAGGPRLQVVCDENGAGQDMLGPNCARAAEAVMDEIGAVHPIKAIVVMGWRGCFPGAFCPLMPEDAPPSPLVATVGVRFLDGAPSILRDVTFPVSGRRPIVTRLEGIDPDQFIDGMIPPPRGAWVTSVQLPSGA